MLLATASSEGVRVWNLLSGELLGSPPGHGGRPRSVAWGQGRDGRLLLASAGTDNLVTVGPPLSGETPAALNGHQGAVRSVAWGYQADGRPLIAARVTSGLQIWDAETGEKLRTITDNLLSDSRVVWVYLTDGRPVVAIGSSGRGSAVSIYDPTTGERLRTLAMREGDTLQALAWGYRPDGAPLLAAGSREGISVWSECDGEYTVSVLTETYPGSAAWAPLVDGRILLAITTEDALQLWDIHSKSLLHEAPIDSSTQAFDILDWIATPDGRLLLASAEGTRRIRIWDVVLDPPARWTEDPPRSRGDRVRTRTESRLVVPRSPATAGARSRWPAPARGRPAQPGRVLESPQEVTPRFEGAEGLAPTSKIRSAVLADGRVLLAAAYSSENTLRIWDATTGDLLHLLQAPLVGSPTADAAYGSPFAWGHLTDGRLVLALVSPDGSLRVLDADTAELIHDHPPDPARARVRSVDWVHDHGGRPLLATSSLERVELWNPETGELIRRLASERRYVDTVLAEGALPDGRPCLVTGAMSAPARVWNVDTGQLIRDLSAPVSQDSPLRRTHSAAWGRAADGGPELAVGTSDGPIHICDPGTGQIHRTLIGHRSLVGSLVWTSVPGCPSVLVSRGQDGLVRIWDPSTGTELAQLSAQHRGALHPTGGPTHSIDLASSPEGDLLLFAATGGSGEGAPSRVWRIATGLPRVTGPEARPLGRLTGPRIAESAQSLLRLGNGGLWPPLGLLADLVTMTGPDDDGSAALCDPRLAALSGEPGISRLRDLSAREPRWGPDARAGFAALLASGVDLPGQYAPPSGADPASLRDALAAALAGRTAAPTGHNGPWPVPVAALRTAAGAVTDQVITLLEILGPPACAADPLLPARLAHRAPELPTLPQRQQRLLAAAGTRPPVNGDNAAAGTLLYSPGTARVARSGPFTRLLPTQLALPAALLTMRLAENQLLYRQHQAPAPPAPEPVTIILDTTPPTFGPAGNCLRLAAHLLTLTLWTHGRHPALVTLADPEAVSELRTPADLLRLWTSATLDPPAALLPAARRTAAALGQPAVLFTHYRTAADAGYHPGPASRLLTTHQPPDKPRAAGAPVGPWHAHLSPNPTETDLTAAIALLLRPLAAIAFLLGDRQGKSKSFARTVACSTFPRRLIRLR
jgi:WD40 repeat protein